jgi:hypothetical protein
MSREGVTDGPSRHGLPMVLADAGQGLIPEDLFQLGFIDQELFKVLVGPKFPSHVSRGAKAAKTILEGLVNGPDQHVDHSGRIEDSLNEVASIRGENKSTPVDLFVHRDSFLRKPGADQGDHLRGSQVEAPLIVLEPFLQERKDDGQLFARLAFINETFVTTGFLGQYLRNHRLLPQVLGILAYG